ncbi:axial budding pattern protein 2 [Diplogelasinospora grovesii]|uniref:Axial budding pattern protein 2 n=1 Tax=Diplogelasinospora grovesii TaxID=303347 RepID=A0AAN6NCI9_9PEZI|nr:axial budding pattern protein 2 [Diplogelasinospora grovesii]
MASLMLVWMLLLARLSKAAPSVSFPVNSQVPPVARIGHFYSFVFSSSTFSSPSSNITYSLARPPRWLSIDGGARRLFGTPSEADIGAGEAVGVPISLIATDDSGSTALDATLVVSRNPAPAVILPLERQVPEFGVFSSPSSILSSPDTPFTFKLADNTFSKPAGNPLNYYAVMADNTPLPAWISFNPSELSFSGRTTPSGVLIQPPQTFAFQLVASDVVGFSATSLVFEIIVGNHELRIDRTTVVLNVTAGSSVNYTALQGSVKLDGKPATSADVSVVSTPNIPPWLSVGKDTWHISGTPPKTAKSTNFTITLEDAFSDALNVTVSIQIAGGALQTSSLFRGPLPELNVTTGKNFSLSLGPYLNDPQDSELSAVFDSSPPWVHLDAIGMAVYGDVPKGLPDTVFGLVIKARSRSSGSIESQTLTVHIEAVLGDAGQTTASASSGSPRPTASSTDNSVYSANDSFAASINYILLAALLPTFLLLIALVCLLFWCFRRKRGHEKPKFNTRDISGPLPGIFVAHEGGLPSSESTRRLGRRHTTVYLNDSLFQPGHEGEEQSQACRFTEPNSDASRPLAILRVVQASEISGSITDSASEQNSTYLLPTHQTEALQLGMQGRRSHESMSGISETSSYQDGLLGIGDGDSFRDALEINIPTLDDIRSIQPTPDSAYTGETCHQDTGDLSSSPAHGPSSVVDPDCHVFPLKLKPRVVPPSTTGKTFAWPWHNNNNKGAKKEASFVALAAADNFAYEKTFKMAKVAEAEDQISAALSVSPPPLAKLPRQAVSCGPVTRRGPEPNLQRFGSNASSRTRETPLTSEDHDGRITMSSARQQPPHDYLGISYEDLVNTSPFHPSNTISTVPSAGQWCDETIESITSTNGWPLPHRDELSIDAFPTPPRQGLGGDCIGRAVSKDMSSTSGFDDAEKNGSQNDGRESRENLRLDIHSRSQWFSSGASEESKESDYAVFI